MTVRILHIIDRLDCYGTSRQLSLLLQGLQANTFCHRICALGVAALLPEELAAERSRVCEISSRGLIDPIWPARMCRLLRDFRPQIIHGWGGRANVMAMLAGFIRREAALVLSRRCVAQQAGDGSALLQRTMLRRARKIVVNSAAIWDELAALGTAKEKLTLISNAVVPPGRPLLSRRQLLTELGLPRDCRLVCTAGRLNWHAGIKDAIWAADLLKVIRKDVHLLIAGDGPQRDQLVLFRDQVRIQDKVHFLGVLADFRRILAHCDVFWAPGHRVGQPNAVLEAMAAGIPVVATQVPGNAELIQPHATGYLITPGDRAELARFTNQLLNDAELARRIGQAGRNFAIADFSAAKVAARYAQLYREVV